MGKVEASNQDLEDDPQHSFWVWGKEAWTVRTDTDTPRNWKRGRIRVGNFSLDYANAKKRMELRALICMSSHKEEDGREMGPENVEPHRDLQTVLRQPISQALIEKVRKE